MEKKKTTKYERLCGIVEMALGAFRIDVDAAKMYEHEYHHEVDRFDHVVHFDYNRSSIDNLASYTRPAEIRVENHLVDKKTRSAYDWGIIRTADFWGGNPEAVENAKPEVTTQGFFKRAWSQDGRSDEYIVLFTTDFAHVTGFRYSEGACKYLPGAIFNMDLGLAVYALITAQNAEARKLPRK